MASADELKEIQRLTSSISKMMDGISDKSDKRNRALEKEANIMKSIASSLKEEEDLTKGIEALERRKSNILKSNYGVNQSLKSDLLKMNQISIDSLNVERKKLQVLSKVNQIASNIGNGLSSSLDKFKSQIEEVPILGKAIASIIPSDKINASISAATQGFQRGFGVMFKRSLSQGKGFIKSFGSGMKAGMSQIGKSLGPLLTNPYVLAAVAIGAMLGAGLIGYAKLDAASKAFRNETGLLKSQTEGITNSINSSYISTVALGASMEDVAMAAATFTKEFDNIEQPSEAVLTNMVTLNKNFGIGVSESAKLNKVFQNMAGLSAEQAQYQISQVAEASKLAGVAPQQVIQDMAESSEYAYRYFGGSVEELSKAAVEAAKLGTSIAQAGKVADNLLDFQSSVSSELEAQAMLGVRLNFGQARYLAANGDILGSQQAIIDQVQQNVDLTRLNTYEQEALAKATGMSIGDLKNQVRIREQFGKLDKEQMAAAMDLLNSGKDLSKVSQKDLETKTQELARQREMQSEMDNMKNELKSVGAGLMQALMPLGKVLFSTFSLIGSVLKGIIGPIGAAINSVMVALKPVGDMFKEMFGDGAGLSSIFEIIGKILSGPIVFAINIFTNGIKMVASLVTGIYDVFKGIFTGDFSLIADGLMSIGESILRYFYQIPMALFDTFTQLFPNIGKSLSDMGKKVLDSFTNIIPNISSSFSNIGTKILDGFKTIGPKLLNFFGGVIKGWFNIISYIPTKLYEAFVGIFPAIGDFFSNLIDTIKQKLLGLLPSWAQRVLGGSVTSEVQQQQTAQPVVQTSNGEGNNIPMLAEGGIVQSPIQAIVGEAGPEAVIPLDQLSNIISSTTGGQGGGRPSWVDEVVSAIRENKDVYMDRVKVSSTVTDTQERSGRQNRFGLQGA